MKLRASHILIIGTLIVLGTAVTWFLISNRSRVSTDTRLPSSSAPNPSSLTARTSVDSRSYKDVRAEIETARVSLASRYRRATTPAQKTEIIAEARNAITRSIYVDMFPFWYGTPWDFNGTTETPGQGKIACGYFVSTLLRDSGMKVQRVKLAQQASENIILSLTTEAHVKRFRRVAISEFVAAVTEWGPGLYVVGLDIHTGFIVNTGSEVLFIHSSYIEPYSVVRELASESKILASSQYRIIGKLSADEQLIVKWLLGTEIMTKREL